MNTVTLSEARAYGAERAGQFLILWRSDDKQAYLWLGLGDTVEEALLDAEREARESGIVGGEVVPHVVVE